MNHWENAVHVDLIPLDSKSCPSCGVTFVADNVIEVLGDWLTATGLETKIYSKIR